MTIVYRTQFPEGNKPYAFYFRGLDELPFCYFNAYHVSELPLRLIIVRYAIRAMLSISSIVPTELNTRMLSKTGFATSNLTGNHPRRPALPGNSPPPCFRRPQSPSEAARPPVWPAEAISRPHIGRMFVTRTPGKNAPP